MLLFTVTPVSPMLSTIFIGIDVPRDRAIYSSSFARILPVSKHFVTSAISWKPRFVDPCKWPDLEQKLQSGLFFLFIINIVHKFVLYYNYGKYVQIGKTVKNIQIFMLTHNVCYIKKIQIKFC